MVSAAFMVAPVASASEREFEAAPPDGFDSLAAERRLVLDVYFGGQKLGTAPATVTPGVLRFDDPAVVARLVPDLLSVETVANALSGALPANSGLVCGPMAVETCGRLTPEAAGVILDEDNFRVEVFLHPSLLRLEERSADFLDVPDERPSLVSLVGATLSGSGFGIDAYHFQNRSIAAIGAVRLRSDSSVSTGAGLSFDTVTLEADHRSLRYRAGLFWARGTELVGRRRVAGIGFGTQLDTRADREELLGTPLTVFLQQPARVELLVDDKLVSSRIYAAGHTLIDTGSLPEGSYEVLLRIEEDGRGPREERRFFTKGSTLAPIGRPLFSATAGFLQASDNRLAIDTGTPFYEATAAYRLTGGVGLDASLLGTQEKAILETGALFATRIAQVRIAALASSSGDYGAVLRGSTVSGGPLAFSFDLRSIESRDGEPLLPVTNARGTFSDEGEIGFADRGSFTQGLAILDWRFGFGSLRVTGLYRKNASEKASYSIGTSLEVPVARSQGWDLRVQADARRSDAGFSGFVGLRFFVTGGGMAVSGTSGIAHDASRPGDATYLVGETQAAWNRQLSDSMNLASDAAFGRDSGGSYARASSWLRSSLLNARADVLHQFGDDGRGTRFSATVDSALAVAGDAVDVGGRHADDAAALVTVRGGAEEQRFDVLVDGSVRGTLSGSDRLALFLKPYEEYAIRLQPSGSLISSFDTAARTVTVYPGTVVELDWDVTPLVILFGRAVNSAGQPIANADMTGAHGIGRTDGDGYFQIEVGSKDEIRLTRLGGESCSLAIPHEQPVDGYISAGDVRCE